MRLYNLNILNRIDEIYTDNPEYGYLYIHKYLLENGFKVGRDRVLQYMRIMGIEAIYSHKKNLLLRRMVSIRFTVIYLDNIGTNPKRAEPSMRHMRMRFGLAT